MLLLVAVILWSVTHGSAASIPSNKKPEQIHIAFGDNPCESVSVTWSTQEATNEAAVKYGRGVLTKRVIGTSSRFEDGGPEKRVQYIHRVILKGLRPATQYGKQDIDGKVYSCGSDEGSWSELFAFRSADNMSDWAPTVAVFGDMGTSNARILPDIAALVKNHQLDALIHVGDFAYDMNSDNGRVGDEYMKQIEPAAANIPYMVSPGNHERAYNFSHFKERFTMPGNAENLFYSFNLGHAHFISINTEAYYFLYYGRTVLKNQYDWLINDLKEANKPARREKQPWIIVYGHKPMYCSNRHTDDCSIKETKTRVGLRHNEIYEYGLEDLFYKYEVDLLLWGHMHSYERLWPIYDYQVKNGSYENPYTNPKAPVHITSGVAGSKHEIFSFSNDKPEWSALRSEDYGYMILQIQNNSHLHIKQISVEQGGKPVDDTWIIKNPQSPYQ